MTTNEHAAPNDPLDETDPAEAVGDLLHDTALTADPDARGRYHGTVTESWRIFQAFGGVTFGMAHRAAREHLDRPEFAPVTASAMFCAPVPPGPVTIDVDVVRNGRTAAQVVAELCVPGTDGVALRMQTTFGAPQHHDLAFTDTTFPDDAGSPLDWPLPPPRPADDPFGDLPFHRQTDWRFCIGTRPWDDDPTPGPARAGSWTRLHRPAVRDDNSYDPIGICVPADSIGSAIGQAFGGDPSFFVLTLELGVRFVAPQQSPWVLQHMRAHEATDGYSFGTTELWDTDRRLLAIATQTARLRPLAPDETPGG